MKINKDSRNKLKGSVLFTVIAVMMVTLVFVMSALTIAGATSRRAYSDYAKSQTQYTARSAIDAVTQYLQKSGEFTKKIKSMNTVGDAGAFDVTVSYTAADGSVDNVAVKVELVAKDYLYTDGEKHDVVSITATSEMLNESSGISLFLLKDSPGTAVGGFSNALTTLGEFNPGAGKILSYGGSSLNLNLSDEGKLLDETLEMNENNGANYRGNMVYNSSVKFGTASVYEYILNRDIYNVPEGIVCYGDFEIQKGVKVRSEMKPNDSFTNTELPYMFVAGTLTLTSSDGTYIGDTISPVNVYCNQLISTGKENITGDVCVWEKSFDYPQDLIKNNYDYKDAYGNSLAKYYYTYLGTNSEDAETFSVNFSKTEDETLKTVTLEMETCNQSVSKIGGNDTTNLISWANSVLEGEGGTEYFGNLFTKGSIWFAGKANINGNVNVEQGVYITENNGVVDMSSSTLTVGGVLVTDCWNWAPVVGKLCLTSADNIVFAGNKGITVGGVTYNTIEEFNKAIPPKNEDGTDNPNYNPNIIIDSSKTSNFPSDMEKSEILKTILTKESVISGHYNKDAEEPYANMKHRDFFSAAESTIYTNSDIPDTITGSCTISGKIMKPITIDATSGKIFIILDNLELNDGGSIVVNSNANDVYFFSDSKITVNGGGGAKIITSNFDTAINTGADIDLLEKPGSLEILAKNHLNECGACQDTNEETALANAKAHIVNYHIAHECNGYTYLDSDGNFKTAGKCTNEESVKEHLIRARQWMPNVYLYMDKKSDGSNSELEILNNGIITAYVYAPYTNITSYNAKQLNNLTFNGKALPANMACSIIGSTTADYIDPGSNEQGFFFIDPSGASGGIIDADGGTWFPMYYQNSDLLD